MFAIKFLGVFLCFLIGLCFGSFLNCLIYRLQTKKGILGRSFCPKCGHQLSWYENIPLFSFIFQRSRCRSCHQRISWQYPIVELTTGILFVIAFIRLTPFVFRVEIVLSLLIQWFIFFVLLFIFIYDLKYQEIELIILWPATALVFFYNFFTKHPLNPLIVSISIGVLFFLIQYLITRGKGIGLGDVWIGAFMGVVFSQPKLIITALFLSYLVGSLVSIIFLISKKAGLKTKIPLAPFLVIGTFISLFWGENFINWYLKKLYF